MSWSLHVCYGNRYARPLWEGHYDFLFPAVKQTSVDVLALEFARTGDSDLVLLEQHGWDHGLGLGVIDVKTPRVETPEQVAARIRRALTGRAAGTAGDQSRLRPAAPAAGHSPGEARRDGGRGGAGPRRAFRPDRARGGP